MFRSVFIVFEIVQQQFSNTKNKGIVFGKEFLVMLEDNAGELP